MRADMEKMPDSLFGPMPLTVGVEVVTSGLGERSIGKPIRELQAIGLMHRSIGMGFLVSRAERATGLLALLAFWAAIAMAAWRYPTEFGWRYLTVSALLSASHNPAGHRWAALGIVLGAGGIGCWALSLARYAGQGRGRPRPGRSMRSGRGAFCWPGSASSHTRCRASGRATRY